MAGSVQRGGGRSGFRDINITPLVDVMLVLLVVFIVTAPLMTSGLRVELPKVGGDPTPAQDTRVVVTVSAQGEVFLGEDPLGADFATALCEDERVQARGEIHVRGDQEARYGVVAAVVAAARDCGIEGINLVVQPLPPAERDKT